MNKYTCAAKATISIISPNARQKNIYDRSKGGKNNCDDIIGSSFAEELRSFG